MSGRVLGSSFQGLAKGGWSQTPFLAGWIRHEAWLVWKGDDVLESSFLIKGWSGIWLKVVSRSLNKPGNQQWHLRRRTFGFERREERTHDPKEKLFAFYISMKTPSEPANNAPSNNNENNAPIDNAAEIKNSCSLWQAQCNKAPLYFNHVWLSAKRSREVKSLVIGERLCVARTSERKKKV